MKDVEGIMRGTCGACTGCPEYAVKTDGSNTCEECQCPVGRHVAADGNTGDGTGKNAKGEKVSLVGQALAGADNNRYAFVATWVFYSILVWGSITGCITLYMLSGAHKTKAQAIFENDHISTILHKYCCGGYAFGICFSFLTYLGTRNPERKSLAISLVGIKFIAFMSYFLQFHKLTPAVMMPNGVPYLTSRSLEWMFCTPCLMWVYRQITCAYDPMANSIALDIAMVVTGWIGAVAPEPYGAFWNTVSCLVYLPVIDHIMDMFQRAIEEKTDCRLDKQSLYWAKTAVWAAWWGFTVVYYLQKDVIVDFATGEFLYVCCDMIAKVVFSLILINASQESSAAERVGKLSAAAAELETQMDNSDALLEKMMPANVLEQIKNGQGTEAEEFQSVTVFFSDIANFGSLSNKASAKEMINILNALWREYDVVAKKWNVYKVETIGDAYLGVTGCPKRCDGHAVQGVNFAIDLIAMAKAFKAGNLDEGVQIRIGLNSGSVTAGVLGDLNPHWCLVGDTVNTASRMESTSKPLCVHISESTYNLVKHDPTLDISAPDVMNVKGKGVMNTFWVHGRK
ncbi:hypothetical protein SmJEL517_g04188 [Synchytrium microbalum]|uniref:Guanylate cyclase domain-containing protein n=1 Tax=Synchytrium microbalum TaxID=1806994 RepID=A0A507C566_9FUNG|nr:uncharacterized protein SmJEL517_g04188 [Synchytrium microbalum]TPX32683.1 hypothetical protein SmJEL517_g04188 [Synchytrium microbalum]